MHPQVGSTRLCIWALTQMSSTVQYSTVQYSTVQYSTVQQSFCQEFRATAALSSDLICLSFAAACYHRCRPPALHSCLLSSSASLQQPQQQPGTRQQQCASCPGQYIHAPGTRTPQWHWSMQLCLPSPATPLLCTVPAQHSSQRQPPTAPLSTVSAQLQDRCLRRSSNITTWGPSRLATASTASQMSCQRHAVAPLPCQARSQQQWRQRQGRRCSAYSDSCTHYPTAQTSGTASHWQLSCRPLGMASVVISGRLCAAAPAH
jgi:hypothetical protein